MSRINVRVLEVAGEQVAVREWGDGDRLLLALHAMGPVSTGALYGCAVGPLVEAGYRVVAPDLPGFGRTPTLPPEEYDVARMAARAWRWVDALGGDRITLVGHSWGGAIALQMQQQHGDRLDALVLVDSGHLDYGVLNPADAEATLEEWVERARGRRIVVPDRAALADELEVAADDPVLDDLLEGVVETEAGLVSRVDPAGQGAAFLHLARASQSGTWPALAARGTPTLLLLATEPESARKQNEPAAETFAAAVPQADVRLVPGAAHSLVTDLREEFGRMVATWLNSLR